MIGPAALFVLWVATSSQQPECVAISSQGRLNAGANFAQSLPASLDLRLRADGSYGWTISVVPRGGDRDYAWVVSPPYQTAPHLSFGPVYGLTATQSAQFERELRFVLSVADYQRAFELHARWSRGAATAEETNARRSQIATGTLKLRVTNFAVQPHVKTPGGSEVEAFDWIEFTGQACVPRGGLQWIP